MSCRIIYLPHRLICTYQLTHGKTETSETAPIPFALPSLSESQKEGSQIVLC